MFSIHLDSETFFCGISMDCGHALAQSTNRSLGRELKMGLTKQETNTASAALNHPDSVING